MSRRTICETLAEIAASLRHGDDEPGGTIDFDLDGDDDKEPACRSFFEDRRQASGTTKMPLFPFWLIVSAGCGRNRVASTDADIATGP